MDEALTGAPWDNGLDGRLSLGYGTSSTAQGNCRHFAFRHIRRDGSLIGGWSSVFNPTSLYRVILPSSLDSYHHGSLYDGSTDHWPGGFTVLTLNRFRGTPQQQLEIGNCLRNEARSSSLGWLRALPLGHETTTYPLPSLSYFHLLFKTIWWAGSYANLQDCLCPLVDTGTSRSHPNNRKSYWAYSSSLHVQWIVFYYF